MRFNMLLELSKVHNTPGDYLTHSNSSFYCNMQGTTRNTPWRMSRETMTTMDQTGSSFIHAIRIAVWLTNETLKVGRQLDSLLWFISVGLTSMFISTPLHEYTRGSLGQMGAGLVDSQWTRRSRKDMSRSSLSKLLSQHYEKCADSRWGLSTKCTISLQGHLTMMMEWSKVYKASAAGVGCLWVSVERDVSFIQHREAGLVFIIYYNCAGDVRPLVTSSHSLHAHNKHEIVFLTVLLYMLGS